MKQSLGEQCNQLLQEVKFGDIDGMYDLDLEEYFIDRDYFEGLFEKNNFFVIGRKGTGKSALYNWIHTTSSKKGNICINILFNEFPFQRLLELKDNSFAQPYQYQTICKNMILGQFAYSIVTDENHLDNDEYKQLVYYINNFIGRGVDDCFRKTINKVREKSGSLNLEKISLAKTNCVEETYGFDDTDLNQINSVLQRIIVHYLKIYPCSTRFIIQIDGIDENYNQVTAFEGKINDYMQLIISLMKSVYGINQAFYKDKINIAKCVVYLRSDIFNSIHEFDPESARWEQHTMTLSWVITARNKWLYNDLRKLINTRITCSIAYMNGYDGFSELINYRAVCLNNKSGLLERHLFEYIVNRTFHRPRDIIQFMIKLQEASKQEGELNYTSFSLAEKNYSLWFLSEITNEISPKIKNIKALFSFLRTIGSKPINQSTFKKKYEKFQAQIGLPVEELLEYLYSIAIISNINDKGKWFSVIRNEKSTLNPDIKIILHPGFWKGLYTSTF